MPNRYRSTRTYCYGSDGYPLAEVVASAFEDLDQVGVLEQVDIRSGNTAAAFGRLLEVLHAKGLLTLEELSKIVDTQISKAE